MFLHKDVESWALVSAKAVMGGSEKQGENVLAMALADIQRLGEELAELKADADAMASRIQTGDRARDDVIEECAVAARMADRTGYEWVLHSVWDRAAERAAAAVRALKTKPLN